MIKLYYTKFGHSCNRAKDWLNTHGILFEEINMMTDGINFDDIIKILSLTENGVEEVISRRSRAFRCLDLDLDTISLHELVALIIEDRTLLRRPLIFDDNRLQVGYNEDDIRQFLPRKVRNIELNEAKKNIYQMDREPD